ncbi:MAG TPA: glycosyltransferase family 2 protein [Caulobacterales bacterium]|nr:glycosyltransferase family 2 protein [Caulobacterales bacterium]
MRADAPQPLPAQMRRKRPAPPLVSLVVPVFNEEDVIPVFLDRVRPLLSSDAEWEILFINDGSRDRTLEVLFASAEKDPRIVVLNLSRNFGKEAALTAGIDHARGDALVILDVDLQDPPELIGDFLARWREGYDVVYGVRVDRSSDTFLKRFMAAAYYRVFGALTETPMPPNVGDFRLIDRRVAEALRQLPERNRFMKGLFAWVGFPACAVPYVRPKRAAGATKFRFRRLWNFALDGIVGFSAAPIKIWTYLGLSVGAAAAIYAGFIAIKTMIEGVEVPGYASTMIAILLACALQLVSTGILGEYVGRLFTEVKHRPIYLLEGLYTHAPDADGAERGEAATLIPKDQSTASR